MNFIFLFMIWLSVICFFGGVIFYSWNNSICRQSIGREASDEWWALIFWQFLGLCMFYLLVGHVGDDWASLWRDFLFSLLLSRYCWIDFKVDLRSKISTFISKSNSQSWFQSWLFVNPIVILVAHLISITMLLITGTQQVSITWVRQPLSKATLLASGNNIVHCDQDCAFK